MNGEPHVRPLILSADQSCGTNQAWNDRATTIQLLPTVSRDSSCDDLNSAPREPLHPLVYSFLARKHGIPGHLSTWAERVPVVAPATINPPFASLFAVLVNRFPHVRLRLPAAT